MKLPSDSRSQIRPTLHHFGLTTANLQGMKEWYAKVLGMTPNHETTAPDGKKRYTEFATPYSGMPQVVRPEGRIARSQALS